MARPRLSTDHNTFMSSAQPNVAGTIPQTGVGDLAIDANSYNDSEFPPSETQARAIVRLFQCQLCSKPFKEAVTLPCGKTLCKKCLPDTYQRANITYPNLPDRRQGLLCPFVDCSKEHALADCNVDVVLNKTAQHMLERVELGKLEAVRLNTWTSIFIQDSGMAAGISTLEQHVASRKVQGGKFIATWILAENGDLRVDMEASYDQPPGTIFTEAVAAEMETLRLAQDMMRTEMDCQVCYGLLYDPLTTGCGHTFCRSCLHRILDHSQCCPVCRRKMQLNPLLNRTSSPTNDSIRKITEIFWWDELVVRKDTLAADELSRHEDFDIPLFVCTLAFPYVPTFLHVFEPRYRLMIRRCLEGDRTFGMVLPKRARNAGDAHFHDLGTLVRVINAQFYPDGRSLIETVGVSRFRVIRHGAVDGYAVGQIERIDDIGLEEEETIEAQEIAQHNVVESTADPSSRSNSPRNTSSRSNSPRTGQDAGIEDHRTQVPDPLHVVGDMSTQSLMLYATDFVNRMQAQSVPWLTERMLIIYGECPTDPAIFPWWFGSMLPVKDLEKYRLLRTTSVRDRLKICHRWITEWEASRW